MYTNPIILRNLTAPLLTRKAHHASPCGPYYLRPVGDRNGTKAGGWGEYQYREGVLGGVLWELRAEDANKHLREAGCYRQARISGYYSGLDTASDLWIPLVVRLNHGRGFLAAASLGVGMCATVDAGIYDTPESAAWAAHTVAERLAEAAREAEEEFQREQALEGSEELPEDEREN